MPEITANGLRFHYQRVGSGSTPVVMLHGLMIDDLSSLYFTAAPALADVADVVLYDLRGHGKTEQPATGYGPDEAVDGDHLLVDGRWVRTTREGDHVVSTVIHR